MTSRILLLWQAFLAALAVVSGAANLADLMPERAAAWFVLGVAALSAGTGVIQARVGTMPADTPPAARSLLSRK